MVAEKRESVDEVNKKDILQPLGVIIEFPTPIRTESEVKTEEAYINTVESDVYPDIRKIIAEKRKINPAITIYDVFRMFTPPSTPEDY